MTDEMEEVISTVTTQMTDVVEQVNSDKDTDSDAEFIYSATYLTIALFNYIKFQTNGPKRPPFRQNNVTGME